MSTTAPDGPASAPVDASVDVAPAAPRPRDEVPPDSPSPGVPVPGDRPAAERPVLPRSLVMLLGAGSAVLVLAGIHAVSWLVGPVFLALMIVIAISPVQNTMLRHGWPAWLSTLVLVVLVTGVLVVFAFVFVVSIAR